MFDKETALEIRDKVMEMERELRAYYLAGGGPHGGGSILGVAAVVDYINEKLNEESRN